ncbi:MAG: hypothetical protein N3A70_06565 [Anoxybacillus gonensis]|nr:hypothetical protein [Anoxybacillus gonensis]
MIDVCLQMLGKNPLELMFYRLAIEFLGTKMVNLNDWAILQVWMQIIWGISKAEASVSLAFGDRKAETCQFNLKIRFVQE